MRALPAGDLTQMVGDWMAEKLGIPFQAGTYQALMVVDDNNTFVAGVIVNNYSGHDCFVSAAAETPFAWHPRVRRAVSHYIFKQLGCKRCTAVVRKNNKRVRRFLERLGCTLEGNLRRGYDGKHDALIYGLLVEECRFLAADSEG
jgi:hypothetical protein